MQLYHFTALHLLPNILNQGITLGMVPVNYKPQFITGYQWLTVNPDFQQSWNGQINVKYDRAAVRLTIEIPSIWQNKVQNWLQVCRKLSDVHDDLNCFGDPENWRLFKGVIRPAWIKSVVKRY